MADTQTLHSGLAGDKAPLLEVEGLKTYFRTNRGILKAVDGISFTIDAGKTLGIVGESGSGKSVTVRSIMNLLPPAVTINAGGSALAFVTSMLN
jgi:ABC-type dipeptide/oligopeptide/nickel transport system ATPase component